ncbi:hypothetical protein J1614_000466 [Plenodomus biglobosus]|nr:hypothetical protein J1614_000466 [Plenodomus biglobosus]
MAHSTTSASAPAGPPPPSNNVRDNDNDNDNDNGKTTPEPQPNHPKPHYESIIRPPPAHQQPQDTTFLSLDRTITPLTHPEIPCLTLAPTTSDTDAIYTKFSTRRKHVIVATVSFCSFLAPVSSTTVLAAVPEVAATFGTDGSIVNVSNALYMLFMGVSPCFYGPIAGVWGRKWVCFFFFFLFFFFLFS